jgi:hypothetical protein
VAQSTNETHREATQLDIVTSTSESEFTQSAETVYDFVTNPQNWTKTYPGSAHIGDLEGRITVSCQFTRPGQDITLFSRTMTIEAHKHVPLPDRLFQQANPAKIDAYHEAVARELARASD